MFLGIEIGGTKLQLGVGPGDGSLTGLCRLAVDVERGAHGIRKQIVRAVPQLLADAQRRTSEIQGIGIGFGGPVDEHRRCVIKSHQIPGWDDYPLAQWAEGEFKLPVSIGNDADVAGLAEARLGAGRGCNPVFYVTIGSGVGGGLIIDGRIMRGVGLGAAEVGHLRMRTAFGYVPLEELCSGWGIQNRTRRSVPELAERIRNGDTEAQVMLNEAWSYLAEGLCHVIALVCPQRIVIGGGVSLIGDLLFKPLRELVSSRVFRPFATCTDIVPAQLGEEVVVQGALLLARQLHEIG